MTLYMAPRGKRSPKKNPKQPLQASLKSKIMKPSYTWFFWHTRSCFIKVCSKNMLLIMMTLFLAPRGKQPPQNYPQTAILSKMSFIANNDYFSGTTIHTLNLLNLWFTIGAGWSYITAPRVPGSPLYNPRLPKSIESVKQSSTKT